MNKDNRKLATELVARHTQHGLSKSQAKALGKIASIGTERAYRQCVFNYLEWCDLNKVHPSLRANISMLNDYIDERREWVGQKTLDQERQALSLVYKQKLLYKRVYQESVNEKRSYTYDEVKAIAAHQSEKNAIPTFLSFYSGIRAHEAATILPISERKASVHRSWDPHRFIGLPDFLLYTVKGKGGLVREIAVPIWLARKLEARRRPPTRVVDREIIYLSCYDIGFGQSWSQSVTTACKIAIKVSRGAHGLRHSYAKWRLHHITQEMIAARHGEGEHNLEEQALLILSQELGHFRLDVVYCYLR
ncbi:MAG: hypothetical protein WB870_12040 [Gallionellaceae bacterium]